MNRSDVPDYLAPRAFSQLNGGMPSFRLYDPNRPEDLPEALLVAYGIIGKYANRFGSITVTREETEEYSRCKLPRFDFGQLIGEVTIVPLAMEGQG